MFVMRNINTMKIELSTDQLYEISSIIKNKGIWFKEIELEYRKNNNMLLVRLVGAKNMKLSDNYVQKISNQLEQLQKDFTTPLIKKIKANFVLSLSVNASGTFSFNDVSLKLKADCGMGLNMDDSFREPFKVIMPFALYITNLEFRGHKYRMAVVEAAIKITSEELQEIVEYPLIAPRTRKQWLNLASIIYEEAKEEYRYDVSIPCVEGEIYWDNKVDVIQITLLDKKPRAHVL